MNRNKKLDFFLTFVRRLFTVVMKSKFAYPLLLPAEHVSSKDYPSKMCPSENQCLTASQSKGG